jgi:hypothetical protein
MKEKIPIVQFLELKLVTSSSKITVERMKKKRFSDAHLRSKKNNIDRKFFSSSYGIVQFIEIFHKNKF